MQEKQNETSVEEIFSDHVSIIYTTICITIIISACSLNAISIAMYWSERIRRTYFNFCLLNLSIANMIQQVGFLPYLVIDIRKMKSTVWYLEAARCGLLDGLSIFFTAAFVNVYIICFLSINWYRIIKKPFMKRTEKKRMFLIFCIAWLLGCVMIIPNFLRFKIDEVHGFCVRSGIFGQTFFLFYGGILFLVGLVIPVTIMSIVYILILYLMYKKTNNGEFKSHTKERHRSRIIRFLGVLINIFLVCWLPFGIYWIMNVTDYFTPGIAGDYEKTRINKLVLVPCLLAGVFNIIFYGLTDQEFRRGLRYFINSKSTLRHMRVQLVYTKERGQRKAERGQSIQSSSTNEEEPDISIISRWNDNERTLAGKEN